MLSTESTISAVLPPTYIVYFESSIPSNALGIILLLRYLIEFNASWPLGSPGILAISSA